MGSYDKFEFASAPEILDWAIRSFGDGFAISTSFQKEGMAVIDMAVKISPDVRVFTLDTGCLPPETHRMIEIVGEHYGIQVERVTPDPEEVETMVAAHGRDLYYQGVPLRMLCCQIRKVRPLERKVASLKAWATGLRRGQTAERARIAKVDASGGPLKISPVADWTSDEVDAYLRANGVPVHPLYGRGYTSIGCAPCTRAVYDGEDERAGRWWWEQDNAKECGIHFTPDGRAERTVDVLIQQVLQARGGDFSAVTA